MPTSPLRSPKVKEQMEETAPPPREEEKVEETEGGNEQNRDEGEEDKEEEEALPKALYKSSRFKGYLTLVLASGVSFQAAYVSNAATLISDVVVQRASDQQRSYAMAVAVISMIICAFIIMAHLDCVTPLKKYWRQLFRPKSRFEVLLIVFLMIWWIVALWINTGMDGIAGDGKSQYNLYFSTWICFFVCAWTLERWMVSCGYPSLEGFLASWPNRAPGWIAIFFLSLAALLSILDLYVNWEDASALIKNHYVDIPPSQWEWLLFVTAFSIVPSVGFVLVEIFRETKPGIEKNNKTEWETILEGLFLLVVVIIWIPSVIMATTPGGVAANVGNSYFFVWLTTVFVVDTSVWWIHDWRKRVLTSIREQEKEYRDIQRQVQERSQLEAEEAEGKASRRDLDYSAVDEDISMSSADSIEGQTIPDVAGT